MSDITSEVPLAPPPDEDFDSSGYPGLSSAGPLNRKPLRLWPAVLLVALQWLLMVVPGWLAPASFTQFMLRFYAPLGATAGLFLWWLLLSRISWSDRFLGLLVYIGAAAGAIALCDMSMRPMGMLFYAVPAGTTAWVAWLLLTPFLRWPVRRVGLLAVMVLAWGAWDLFRFEGVTGSFDASFSLRGSATPEDLRRAEAAERQAAAAPITEAIRLEPGDWPGFRGPERDGRCPGVRIATDWQKQPPRLLWKQRVGPGWSSFAVVGDHAWTQEQRDEDEVVVCYDARGGAEVWAYKDKARFFEAVGGLGPRATPTFHEGKIYALGATGKLNCLEAASGKLVWSRDLVEDSGAKVPQWGFSSSPLVVQGIVTVFAGGDDGKGVLGYSAKNGELVWYADTDKASYCSTHRVRLGGVEQLVIATGDGVKSFHPTKGDVLWQHDWKLESGMARVVQPALVGDSDLLVGTGMGIGTRRVHVGGSNSTWYTEEVWTSKAIKPYYNDLVVHGKHLYGLDNNLLTCVSLEDGKDTWRQRGYGNGQVLLLPDQDLLLVLSEKGEAALVEVKPDQYKELGRFQAIKSKTWNHPVVAHGKLFVRNAEEAACYQLAPAP